MPFNLPIGPGVIAMFVVYLNDQGLQPNTIRQKLSAVAYLHKLHKLEDPTKSSDVTNVMRAIMRNFVPPEQKHPITLGLLECLLEVVHLEVQGTYDAHLYRTIFMTMYAACLRVGECVVASERNDKALRKGQITFHKEPRQTDPVPLSYSVEFREFKSRLGRRVPPLLVQRSNNPKYCPVRMLFQYFGMRPRSPYLFVHENGEPVKSTSVALILTKTLIRLRLDPDKYSPHSLRSGKCTDLVSAGRNSEGIRAVGRWQNTAYESYNRPSYILA